MPSIGDLYQLTVIQEAPVSERFVNVFYYAAVSGTPSADDLVSAFVDDLWDVVRSIQAPTIATSSYYAINGMENLDWHLSAANDVGTGGGVMLPAFVAAGFRSPFLGSGKGYSYKRVGGVPTGFVGTSTDGSWNSASLGALQAVQDALGVTVVGDNAAYDPVVLLGGFALGTTPTLKAGTKGQWTTNRFPSSQVTRKPARWLQLDE